MSFKSPSITSDDSQLFNAASNAVTGQGLAFWLFHIPLCWGNAMVLSCCCNNTRGWEAAQDKQEHRFKTCICCNTVLSFSLINDPKYKRHNQSGSFSPVINVMNNNVNNNHVENTSQSNNNISIGAQPSPPAAPAASPSPPPPQAVAAVAVAQPLPSAPEAPKLSMKEQIREKRAQKAMDEGRLSDAEAILSAPIN
jgi:hypothetical protein